MPGMLIVKGPNRGVKYELGDRTRIGRLGENEVQVADPNVSRIHAEIIREGENFVAYDRGSKNGVIVNGEAVAEKILAPGDQITIGCATFVYEPSIAIKNARYSCTPVIYLPSAVGDQLISDPGSKGKADSTGDINDGLTAMCLLASKSLPEAAGHLCEAVRSQLEASHAALFLRDYGSAELYPIETAPREKALFVSNEVLEQCSRTEKTLAFITNIDSDALRPYLEDGPNENVNDQRISLLCAPIKCEKGSSGVLMVSYDGGIDFSEQQVNRLEMAAVLIGLTLQALRPAKPVVPSEAALDAEQRSASTRSLRMQEIYNSARRSASGSAPILITGETGTGKETLARFIHESSERAQAPFVAVHCAGILSAKLETELFGSEVEGADGSITVQPGLIDEAAGGTLFLQEIGELDLAFQPKLLRFVQDRAYTRVNAQWATMADVKLIAASSIDLAAAVRSGNFREDLWYRLNVVPFNMPPLRERREDIAPLLDFFVHYYSVRFNKRVIGANDSAIALLQKYDWPGNIRELNNAVERAVLLAESKVLSTSDFSHIEEARRQLNAKSDLERKRDTRPLAEVERQHIIIALKKHNFNQARAAEALGLHRNTLRNKIIEYGIEIPK